MIKLFKRYEFVIEIKTINNETFYVKDIENSKSVRFCRSRDLAKKYKSINKIYKDLELVRKNQGNSGNKAVIS